MIEVITMIITLPKVGRICRAKGVGPVKYQVMTACMFLGGEFGGLLLGALLTGNVGIAILGMFTGAAFGLWLSFTIVHSITPVKRMKRKRKVKNANSKTGFPSGKSKSRGVVPTRKRSLAERYR